MMTIKFSVAMETSDYKTWFLWIQESPANAKGTCDSSACMKDNCEQM